MGPQISWSLGMAPAQLGTHAYTSNIYTGVTTRSRTCTVRFLNSSIATCTAINHIKLHCRERYRQGRAFPPSTVTKNNGKERAGETTRTTATRTPPVMAPSSRG